MSLRNFLSRLKKGVNAGMMAAKQSDVLTDARIKRIIDEFNGSDKRKQMLIGERYYRVDTDILKTGKSEKESFKANNRIAHAKYKNLVDEKIAYLLAKEYTLKNDDKQYIEKIKTVYKGLTRDLNRLGYEASNKGIGWLQPYIDSDGRFKTMVVPSEQCIPVWTDSTHTTLSDMIRIYDTTNWEYGTKKITRHVEHWTPQGVRHYIVQNSSIFLDAGKSFEDNAPIAHYRKGNEWAAWGRVPFIGFKNNFLELPDICFVKSVIDAYDKARSEAANYVDEVKNLIFILKGYGGENLDEFMRDLNRYRAIKTDPDEHAGVDTLTPTMDITAIREHYEQLKRDILEDGQGVNKDLDKFGSAPSGVALKFMYAGLDLKCNAMEAEFKQAFEQLMYFADVYLLETGQGDYRANDMEIIFNRNMQIDETEQIANCITSQGVISQKTILSKHPWVPDIENEQEQLKKEEEEQRKNEPEWDKILIGADNEEQPILGKENSRKHVDDVQ